MAKSRALRSFLLLAGGFIIGTFLISVSKRTLHAQEAQQGPVPVTEATVVAEAQHLKDITPPSSHPMVDVGYHAANLWFAVQKRNWPLATYYLGETRNRLRWEVKLNPSPKGPSGVI